MAGAEAGEVVPESAAPEAFDPVYVDISTGLFHLRRTWAKPVLHRVRLSDPSGRPLQLSNLMVVYAVSGMAALTRPEAAGNGAGGWGGRDTTDGSAPEVTVGDVADRLEIDPSTASRLVGHAISAGLISRRPSAQDARRASLRLTATGERVIQVADRYRHRYLSELMADWAEEERAEFARLLTRFTEAVARQPMQFEGVGKIFEEALVEEPAEGDHHQGGR